MTYSYSIDEENFQGDYETAEQAAVDGFDIFPDVDTVWVGLNIRHTAPDYVDTQDILERIAENAYEHQIDGDTHWLSRLIKNQQKCEL